MSTYQPLIIIGAARSGTKLLRDVIAAHPVVAKVPYDVNYIWRMGNERTAHDELTPEMLTPQNQSRIRVQLARHADNAPWLVEKTVSNCLRVPFVRTVLPEARFIHLVRDGRDVIESVYRQWTAPPDWRYIWEKARSFPLRYAFGYGVEYGLGLVRKLLAQDKERAATWGPRYQGIDEDMAQKDLWEVCAIQWLRCVELALQGLSQVPAEKQLTIQYEEFVRQPMSYLAQVAEFLNIDAGPYEAVVAAHAISEENIGKGASRLTADQWQMVLPYLEKGLALLNYA